MKSSFFLVALAGALACAHESYSGSGVATRAPNTTVASSLSAEQVRLVQHSLADRGFAVPLTGAYDDATREAVAQFQVARGLPETGSLDAATGEALGIDPQALKSVRGTAADQGTATSDVDQGSPPGRNDLVEHPGE
jgi:peptidoglycan hydrolase-like protein with peptidoglycan-binding domain